MNYRRLHDLIIARAKARTLSEFLSFCRSKMYRPRLSGRPSEGRVKNEKQQKWDFRFLSLARFIGSWSLDPSTQVGAVITDDRRIVSIGYNGLPQNVIDTPERLVNREIKLKMIVHAERNAIIFAQRSLAQCTLYTWPFMSCSACAGMVIQAGIVRVVAPINDNPRWKEDFEIANVMFTEANVQLDLLDFSEP